MKLDFKKDSKMLLLALLSGVIEGISHASFVVPAGLFPGGFSGISRLSSQVLSTFFSISIPYSYIYFSLNAIAAIIVFRYVGKKFTIFSLIQVFTCSVMITTFKPRMNVDDLLLLAIFGAIINGFACGLALSNNFSSGGTDFLTIYFSNKYKKSLWNYTLLVNAFVLTCAGILFGWEIAMYSIIFQFVSTQVIKAMHKRYTHQTLTIITKKKDEVVSEILKGTRHGITISEAEGAYSHEKEYMLMTVVNTYQTRTVMHAILTADPHAFINVQNTVTVKGNYYQEPLE